MERPEQQLAQLLLSILVFCINVSPSLKKLININLLGTKLKDYFYNQKKKVVFLRIDKAVSYGYVIDVMDLFSIASYQSDSAKILLTRQDFGFWQLLVQQLQSVSAFQLHWPFV